MKLIAAIFSIGCSLVFAGPGAARSSERDAPAIASPGFYELRSSSAEGLEYERSRLLAIAQLGNMTGLDEATAALAKKTAEHLASAKFYVAADAEADRQCAQVVASLFVLQTVPDRIFVCADTRWHVQKEPAPVTEILAQGFIHEGVHLAGIADECQATRLELLVAGQNGGITSYANFRRYSKQCEGLLDGFAPTKS